MTAGESVEVNQALVERVRARLEQDGEVIRGTDKTTRRATLHRAARLAVEEVTASPHPITWETARTRPGASPGTDDPRDVLIGRLAVILGVADLGYRSASYDAVVGAAQRLRAERPAPSRGEPTTAPPLAEMLADAPLHPEKRGS
jgi:hypothetical protein